MFEISIFFVIVLAIGYWVAVWLRRRHDDVLHGDFIHEELGSEPRPPPLPPSRADSSETLEALLASIKRDLKDAAQL
jgi:hypothetical protein